MSATTTTNETAIQKQCRIKTAGIKRYIKEYNSYAKEVTLDKAKVDKMILENKDQSSINKMVKNRTKL